MAYLCTSASFLASVHVLIHLMHFTYKYFPFLDCPQVSRSTQLLKYPAVVSALVLPPSFVDHTPPTILAMPRAAKSADPPIDQPDRDRDLNTRVLRNRSFVPLGPAKGQHNQKVTRGHRNDEDEATVCICDPLRSLI